MRARGFESAETLVYAASDDEADNLPERAAIAVDAAREVLQEIKDDEQRRSAPHAR